MFKWFDKICLRFGSTIHYRYYNETSFHHAFRRTLTDAMCLAEKLLKDKGNMSVIVEHEDKIYTVYLETDMIKVKRLK